MLCLPYAGFLKKKEKKMFKLFLVFLLSLILDGKCAIFHHQETALVACDGHSPLLTCNNLHHPAVKVHIRLLTNCLRLPDRLICLTRIDQAERFA